MTRAICAEDGCTMKAVNKRDFDGRPRCMNHHSEYGGNPEWRKQRAAKVTIGQKKRWKRILKIDEELKKLDNLQNELIKSKNLQNETREENITLKDEIHKLRQLNSQLKDQLDRIHNPPVVIDVEDPDPFDEKRDRHGKGVVLALDLLSQV